MTKTSWIIALFLTACLAGYISGSRAVLHNSCNHKWGPWLSGNWDEEEVQNRIRNCGLCGATDMEAK